MNTQRTKIRTLVLALAALAEAFYALLNFQPSAEAATHGQTEETQPATVTPARPTLTLT